MYLSNCLEIIMWLWQIVLSKSGRRSLISHILPPMRLGYSSFQEVGSVISPLNPNGRSDTVWFWSLAYEKQDSFHQLLKSLHLKHSHYVVRKFSQPMKRLRRRGTEADAPQPWWSPQKTVCTDLPAIWLNWAIVKAEPEALIKLLRLWAWNREELSLPRSGKFQVNE